MIVAGKPIVHKLIGEDADFPHPRHKLFYIPRHKRLLNDGALFVMTGNPDSDNRTVGLNLILIGSGHPDIRRRLNDGRGLRYHDRRGLSDHDRGGLSDHDRSWSHHHRRGIGHNHRTRHNSIMYQTAHDSADDSADKSASVVMAVVMVYPMVSTMMPVPAVRTGETCSGAESGRKNQNCRFHLVHILPFPFSAFWRYIKVGNVHQFF
jgi:hypothetical protein